jgi:nitrite reductase (NADH) large subunit
VTLLEGYGWLLPRQLNEKAGKILEQYCSSVGIELKTGVKVEEIVGDERAGGVRLASGKVLPADLVVITTGVRSNSYLARAAGLEVNRGIVVNSHLVSSHPDILAAGDVAEHSGRVYGTWGPSQYQGSIAGLNALGAEAEFGGIPRSNTLKVLGVSLFSIGPIEPEDASYEVVDHEKGGQYFRFMFRDTHLIGAILLGDASLSAPIKHTIEKKTDLSEILQKHPSAADILDHFAGTTE